MKRRTSAREATAASRSLRASSRARTGSESSRRSTISARSTMLLRVCEGPSLSARARRLRSSSIEPVAGAAVSGGAFWAGTCPEEAASTAKTRLAEGFHLDPALPQRVHDSLGAVIHGELLQDGRDVVLHRL